MIGDCSLTEIAAIVGGQLKGQDVRFTAVSTDTRTLQQGDVFVALSGPNFDGDTFAGQAMTRGALAVIVSKPQDLCGAQLVVPSTQNALAAIGKINRARFNGRVVAITGSCGKTTVKELVAHLLTGLGETLATKGNLNNLIGAPLTLSRIAASHRYAVIELGASGLGEIAQTVAWTQPHISILTNAGNAHLEGFGSAENIVKAKGEIIDGLGPDGVAVLNADDPAFRLWCERAQPRQVMSFSVEPSCGADVFADKLSLGELTTFELCHGEQRVRVCLPLAGKHNVSNALAAACAGLLCGMSLTEIAARLASAPGVKGRLEFGELMPGVRLINDSYNANPVSVKAALDVLARCEGKKIAVLGDMAELGDEAESLHQEVGHHARVLGIDALYVTGNYAQAYARGYGADCRCFDDKTRLAAALVSELKATATVLIKGSRSAAMEKVLEDLNMTNKVVQSC